MYVILPTCIYVLTNFCPPKLNLQDFVEALATTMVPPKDVREWTFGE